MPDYTKDFNRIERAIQSNHDFVTCEKCKSNYFEVVEAIKVLQTDTCAIGSAPRNYSRLSMHVLRCMKCGELHELAINPDSSFQELSEYEDFIKAIKSSQE